MNKQELITLINKSVAKHAKESINLRRIIHKSPELGFCEEKTSALVINELKKLGLNPTSHIATTGVSALIKGSAPAQDGQKEKVVILRADMDALPLQELNKCDFASQNKGVMHACGHDFHTANLLGVAKILCEMRPFFHGSFKLIFQPAEEGGGGGREMVKEGILKSPHVDAALALHVYPIPLGEIYMVSDGVMSAYSDRFELIIKGKMAHSSMPYDGIDAIFIAAQIISALQSIIPKNVDPFAVATFSLGTINGGCAANIVPGDVSIKGMIRSLDAKARDVIIEKIESISKGVASALGGSCEFDFHEGYPSVINHPKITSIIKNAQDDYLRSNPNSIEIKEVDPLLGAEDFGFIAARVPSAFFFIGAGEGAPLHNPHFKIQDEDLMPRSMGFMSLCALDILACISKD